jgi:hypothetical protein
MTETATSSTENSRYNDESNFLDGLYEFHPDFFDELTKQEMQSLRTYYLTGMLVPENVFEYRIQVIGEDPGLEDRAHQVFSKLLKVAGIDTFQYTS